MPPKVVLDGLPSPKTGTLPIGVAYGLLDKIYIKGGFVMASTRVAGRGIGVLLLVQMATGLILSFVLTDAVRRGYPSFLETAASSGAIIRAGVVVSVLGAVLTVAIGIWMFQWLEGRSRTLALAFVAVCAISSALDLVHAATILSMLSVSEQYTAAAGVDTALYHAWAIGAASMRRSVHIVQLVGIGAWIFTFYYSLLRHQLVPRPLALLGIAGIMGQFIGVTLMMFLGNSPITYLAMPLAPIHAITAIWIIVRGIDTSPGSSFD